MLQHIHTFRMGSESALPVPPLFPATPRLGYQKSYENTLHVIRQPCLCRPGRERPATLLQTT